MEKLQSTIRNTIRADIIRDGYILLQKKQDELKKERYTLPGGKQKVGETLQEAIERECQEELGTDVITGDILYLTDFFKQKSQPEPLSQQQLDIYFYC